VVSASLKELKIMFKVTPNPPNTDPASPSETHAPDSLNEAAESLLDQPSPPQRNGQLFCVSANINTETLLANASEDLLSISAIAADLADGVDGPRRSKALALSRMADGVHLLVERALDHLDEPEMAAIFARQESHIE
jgi:hypothetical protein